MTNLTVTYKAWRKETEQLIADGDGGTTDCGEQVVRVDFSAWAKLEEEISFEEMFELEQTYEE